MNVLREGLINFQFHHFLSFQISYMVVLTLVFTRVLSVASNNHTAAELHPKVYAIGLIVIWLRFMRSCRVFQTLGPFIAILGLFLFFHIIYILSYYIIFIDKLTILRFSFFFFHRFCYHRHSEIFVSSLRIFLFLTPLVFG